MFYNNTLNAFVVTTKTVEPSLEAGEFKLECIWEVLTKGRRSFRPAPARHAVPRDDPRPTAQHAFYFDYAGSKRQLGRKLLVDVAHHVANTDKNHLKWFMHAVRRYGREESMKAEGRRGIGTSSDFTRTLTRNLYRRRPVQLVDPARQYRPARFHNLVA